MKLPLKPLLEKIKNNILFCLILVLTFFYSSCVNRDTNSANQEMASKPFIDRRIAFIALDENKLSSYQKLSSRSRYEILSEIDTLANHLSHFDLSVVDEYANYYNFYHQPLEFNLYYKQIKQDAIDYLFKVKSEVENSKNIDSLDLSILNEYDLYYNCDAVFKNNWFLKPKIEFSEQFYKKVLPNANELLFFNFYYDGDLNNKNSLPQLSILKTTDEYSISPHYIPKERAARLITDMTLVKDSVLEKEYSIFQHLLNMVKEKKITLVLLNYN